MPKIIYSSWYKNGEDLFFEDMAFHTLAYKITYTYQKFMAGMELKHDKQMAYLLAKKAGWEHELMLLPGHRTEQFKLPGYLLSLTWEEAAQKKKGYATIRLPSET